MFCLDIRRFARYFLRRRSRGFLLPNIIFACKNCLYSNEIRGSTYSIKVRDFVLF